MLFRRSLPQFALAMLLAPPIALPLAAIANLSLPTVAQAQTREDRKAEGDRLFSQAIMQSVSDKNAAIQSLEQALVIYQTIQDQRGEFSVLGLLGNIYVSQLQYEKAISYFEQALSIEKQLTNGNGEAAGTLTDLGDAYYSLTQYEKAIIYYEQSLPFFQVNNFIYGEGARVLMNARVLLRLGDIHRSLSHYRKAIKYYEQALTWVHPTFAMSIST